MRLCGTDDGTFIATLRRDHHLDESTFWFYPACGSLLHWFLDYASEKNPDVPELVRGKTGRVNGHLIALLTLMKSQPLAYNKDNQEDKEPLFDAVDTLTDTLRIYSEMIPGITANHEAMRSAAMRGYATATDLADYLVNKGIPFRDAHEIVAQAVRFAESKSCDLSKLTLAQLQQFTPLIEEDIFSVLTLEGSIKNRNHVGGTAPDQVRQAIAQARRDLT